MNLPPFELPAPDRDLSPITGWTRDHWELTGRRWLDQITRFDSPGGALPRLPGRVTGDGPRRESLETIGRSFLLAAPLIAGSQGADAEDITERYARALLAGTDPDGPESWPMAGFCRLPVVGVQNALVEAANISFGLHLSRERLWDRFTRPEQLQVAAWLRHHARLEAWPNNWQLFPAMAEAFLRSVGEDASGCIGERNVRRVESAYLSQGWYTDGPEHAVDYYNAWAIHPYLWGWYRMTDAEHSPDGQRHLERLAEFVESFAHFVAPDGSLLHVGRSLSYRTAALAALWCAEISGVNPLPPGETRRLASGVLSRFVEAGVGVDEPLDLGWFRPHEPTAQTYSGFGSAYLAGVGFTGLALPADAAVWTAPEMPQVTERELGTHVLAETGWIVVNQGDGIVRLVNHGSDHCEIPVEPTRADPDDPHYAKFGYSTHTAPGTGPAYEDDGVDGHLALVDAEGRASRRGPIRAMRVDGDVAGSAHLPQRDGRALPGCAVVSISVVVGEYEVRAHLVTAPEGYVVREGGWAVADSVEPAGHVGSGPAALVGTGSVNAWMLGLHGWDEAEVVRHVDGNAMGTFSATPVLRARSGGARVFVSLHGLARGEAPELASLAARPPVDVRVDGTTVTVRGEGGVEHRVDLATFVPWDAIVAG